MNFCGVIFESIDIDDLLKSGNTYVCQFEQGRRFLDIAMIHLVRPEDVGISGVTSCEGWTKRCIEQVPKKIKKTFKTNFLAGAAQLKRGPSFENLDGIGVDLSNEWTDWIKTKGYWAYDYQAYAVSLMSQLDTLEKHLKSRDLNGMLNAISTLHILNEQSQMFDLAIEASRQTQREIARYRSLTGHRDSPKRAEKLFIYECWKEWQSKPSQYKSKAEFCRSMLEKCEHLTSTKKIEDWTRLWERGQEP